ncbi:hypothetical protein K2X33_02490, partial [bacterium]|nr:hypothetical protein [bacterium]
RYTFPTGGWMRIGVIASSGGSAFDSMRRVLSGVYGAQDSYYVVTDRPCGVEALCQQAGIPHTRISEPDNTRFSERARDWFQAQGGVDTVLLYFLRLVTPEIYQTYLTFNVHPSLLPAFPGFNPIERAVQKQVRFLGATAHVVDAQTDGGAVVAQVTMPIAAGEDLARLHKYSFIQKVYLSVLVVEMCRQGTLGQTLPFTDRCNPSLSNPGLWNALLELQRSEGVEALR